MPWTDSDTAATAQVASAALDYASAASANRKGRKWAELMYNRQRQDAIADFNMQNEYNSPAANMQRLKAAGLNPNLVYGDGANMPSSAVRSSSVESWKPNAPEVGSHINNAATNYLAKAGLENTQQQTNNLKTAQQLTLAQIDKTIAETLSTGTSTSMSEFNLQQLKAKASTDIAQVKANLAQTEAGTLKTQADTAFTINQDERNAVMQASNLRTAVENLANLKLQGKQIQAGTQNTQQQTEASKTGQAKVNQEIANLASDNQLKKLDIALKNAGLQPHDQPYWRLAKRLTDAMPNPKEFKRIVDEAIKQFSKPILKQLHY